MESRVLNVTGIVGSIRCGGNTETLEKEALAGAEEVNDALTSLLHLGRLDIRPCLLCEPRKCPPDDTLCIIEDDMSRFVYEKLKEADGLVIGAPSYFGGVPSKMKTLIDRMRPFAQIEIRLRKINPLNLKVAGILVVRRWVVWWATRRHQISSGFLLADGYGHRWRKSASGNVGCVRKSCRAWRNSQRPESDECSKVSGEASCPCG